MSKKEHVSATPATVWLKKNGVPFEEGVYEYIDHGGTEQAAKCFGVDEHQVVKTLIPVFSLVNSSPTPVVA